MLKVLNVNASNAKTRVFIEIYFHNLHVKLQKHIPRFILKPLSVMPYYNFK